MGEVRIARQVSHPNVCRVYDVGEFEGHHFITMEYVDGEDLAALLRRIGRLPQEKALDLARQIGAGLAAAHVHGIVHRDLKPANIMLDGSGRARITDFGLAAAAEAIRGKEAQSGTPAYMAPEQLAGGVITPRTDVYALGLVLFEMFTGKRPFDDSAKPISSSGSRPASEAPSRFVPGLDPAIDAAILEVSRARTREPPALGDGSSRDASRGRPIGGGGPCGRDAVPRDGGRGRGREASVDRQYVGALRPHSPRRRRGDLFHGWPERLRSSGDASESGRAPRTRPRNRAPARRRRAAALHGVVGESR